MLSSFLCFRLPVVSSGSRPNFYIFGRRLQIISRFFYPLQTHLRPFLGKKLTNSIFPTSDSEAVLSVGVLHLPPAGRPDPRTGEEQLRLRQENVLLCGYQRSSVPVRRARHSAGPRERLPGDWPEGHGQHHRGTCRRLILWLVSQQYSANLSAPYSTFSPVFLQTGEKYIRIQSNQSSDTVP
jgi:hypothetical protein